MPPGGLAAPPPIVMPATPDRDALTAVMGAPGGIAAAFMDVYGHIQQMGTSIQTILQQHFSSNDVNHDQLEGQIEFNRNKVAEHEAKLDQASSKVSEHETKLDQASTLISDLRAAEAAIKLQLAEASSKFISLEGQFKVLAMKNKDCSSLARDERCRT